MVQGFRAFNSGFGVSGFSVFGDGLGNLSGSAGQVQGFGVKG